MRLVGVSGKLVQIFRAVSPLILISNLPLATAPYQKLSSSPFFLSFFSFSRKCSVKSLKIKIFFNIHHTKKILKLKSIYIFP